jgi:hypothetical protein
MTGGTRWYLSDDCLLAAKRVLYAVEYRRFYLRDLESIVVWRSRWWLWRAIVPGALLTVLGLSLQVWANSTAGAIFTGVGLAWALLEFALGPTAASRITMTGGSIDLPLVQRTRRAAKVLDKIDAAIRASRNLSVQQAASMPSPQPALISSTNSETAPAFPAVADASQNNVS